MPRRKRVATGGFLFHVLNRAVAREKIFWKPDDYLAFETVLQEAGERVPMRLLSYCVMPNHWHLVLWPRGDDDLSGYMRWLTVTHAKRWHSHYHSSGSGALYQGRFKSFPIEQDEHFLTVCRYVERNPLRAKLVDRAQEWRWCSLWHRAQGSRVVSLAAWPVPAGREWVSHVCPEGTSLGQPRVKRRERSERRATLGRREIFRNKTPQGWTYIGR